MNRFKELGELKTKLMLKLTENDNIVKCLACNDINFLDSDISSFDKSKLFYSQIFPYKTNTDILTETKSFITMSFEFNNKNNDLYFKIGRLNFFIIIHKDLIKTDYGMIRYDYLMSEIDSTFNGLNSDLGIGKLVWERSYDFQTDNPNYLGVAISYKNVDFQ